MAHLMPHSILTAARATCQTGSSQSDQIGFSKLLNFFSFLLLNPTKSELRKGSEHSILAQNPKTFPPDACWILFFPKFEACLSCGRANFGIASSRLCNLLPFLVSDLICSCYLLLVSILICSCYRVISNVLVSGMHNRVRHIPEVLLPFLSTVNKM